MSIFFHYSKDKTQIIVKGKTYPYRNAIKSLGARYCGEDKVWCLPYNLETLDKISTLCKQSGGGLLIENLPDIEPTLTKLSTVDQTTEEQETYSILQVMEKAERILKLNFSRSIWISGEIQNIQRKNPGFYFDFSEANPNGQGLATTSIKSTLWDSTYRKICSLGDEDLFRSILQDGMQIRCLCQLTLYKNRGQLSLNVLNIDIEYTKGALALAREKLLKKLRQEGKDRSNKACYLSPLPLHIGLISASGSRAKSDFIHQLCAGGFPGELSFVSCSMQGEKAPGEISKAIHKLSHAACDLIVITRGGGSASDLRWFDMEELAYAIADCKTPILAAIGHHDDYCIAEEICFTKQKTPTAAADYINSLFQEIKYKLDHWSHFIYKKLNAKIMVFQETESRLKNQLKSKLELRFQREKELTNNLEKNISRLMVQKIATSKQRVALISKDLEHTAKHLLNNCSNYLHKNVENRLSINLRESIYRATQKVERYHKELIARDPMPWLKKGWTSLQCGDVRISSVEQVKVGQRLKAKLKDGSLELVIKLIKKEL